MKIIATKIIKLRDIQLETKGSSWTLSYTARTSKWVIRVSNVYGLKFENSNLPDCLDKAIEYIEENRTKLPYSINFQL